MQPVVNWNVSVWCVALKKNGDLLSGHWRGGHFPRAEGQTWSRDLRKVQGPLEKHTDGGKQ